MMVPKPPRLYWVSAGLDDLVCRRIRKEKAARSHERIPESFWQALYRHRLNYVLIIIKQRHLVPLFVCKCRQVTFIITFFFAFCNYILKFNKYECFFFSHRLLYFELIRLRKSQRNEMCNSEFNSFFFHLPLEIYIFTKKKGSRKN